jgi:L-lactate permease
LFIFNGLSWVRKIRIFSRKKKKKTPNFFPRFLYCCRFDPIDALTYTLIFDTTPVAFGALGIPVTTLASITGLPAMKLSAMMGRQLPLLSLFLPSYALIFYAGKKQKQKGTTLLSYTQLNLVIVLH